METTLISSRIKLVNLLNESFKSQISKDVLSGLIKAQKSLPCKYFYDTRGSKLFEAICELPEYYVTRMEMSLLNQCAPLITDGFNKGNLVELGSGTNWKIRTLIDQLDDQSLNQINYIPVDVSKSAMIEASNELVDIYPNLKIKGFIADFTSQLNIIRDKEPMIIVFFGSSIGNFNEQDRELFFNEIAKLLKPEDKFVLALDMIKSVETLEMAYNDDQGITSEFNKNILKVINRELNADFDPDHFEHQAIFNNEEKRIEMHLKANRQIKATIDSLDLTVRFEKGETIHTENSRKYSKDCVKNMARQANLSIYKWHTNNEDNFSIVEFKKNLN
ncbi:MAG: L-histidine N(alpha)-methyltransferase [Deltaproteobacteria bacterium]|nr:L-histidine N(alpha)-methyltransferase [Deltaproteobacteria bacterium]